MAKVVFIKNKPVILANLGVKISQSPFENGSIGKLYRECIANEKESKEMVNLIANRDKHLILGDFLDYAITIENLSRFAAIYLWRNISANNLIFGAGIEASLRVIKPNRYHPVYLKQEVDSLIKIYDKEWVKKRIKAVKNIGKAAFSLYEKAIKAGVPEQDARYVLPEATLTRMIFSAPPRYLIKLAHILKDTSLPELQEIGKKIEKIIKDNFEISFSKEQAPSEWKFFGQEKIKEKIYFNIINKDIYSASLNMGIKGSLAMYAQLVRQRQLLCNIEPLEEIVKRGEFIVPKTFTREIENDYKKLAREAKKEQLKLLERKSPKFVYFLLLGQTAKAMIYGKGFQVIETSRARSEGVAQWEIRDAVGIPLTKELAKFSFLKNQIGPRCWREKICIEPSTFKTKKAICPAFFIAKGKWKKNLDELLKVLKTSYKKFNV